MTLCGYDRISQAEQFIPHDVQAVFRKKLHRDILVTMSHYLIGSDYNEVESPFLPKGLQQEIKSRKMTMLRWTMIVNQKLMNIENAQKYDRFNFVKIYGKMKEMLMFITIYPLSQDPGFIHAILRKCVDFKIDMDDYLFHYNPETKKSEKSFDCEPDNSESYKLRIKETKKLMKVIEECENTYKKIEFRNSLLYKLLYDK